MIKPIYTLADSHLLFWKNGKRRFLQQIREQLDSSNPAAAYIGASNGNNPEFFSLFRAAMREIEVFRHRMISLNATEEDKSFMENADLILLAGGDVERGWQIFEKNKMQELILQRRYGGAVLVGVSAGAVQLGMGSLSESNRMKKLSLLQLLPFYLDVHDEESEWWNLRALVTMSGNKTRGIGIPAGGGMIWNPDGSLEPVRKPLVEFSGDGDRIREHLLLPETGLESSVQQEY